MDQQFEGKSVPWLQLKTYLDIHKRILNFEEMIKNGDLTIAIVESRLPKLLFEIQVEVTKLLKEHNILKEPEDNKLSQL